MQTLNRAAAIAFESILFALTSLKYFQVSRSDWNDNPIVRLLARDGTWWFGLIFCMTSPLVNVV